MSRAKFDVGETVWFTAVGILADKVVIHAIKERRFGPPSYLIGVNRLYQWEPEYKLTRVSDMQLKAKEAKSRPSKASRSTGNGEQA